MQRTRRYGYIDTEGKEVIPPKFCGAWDFSEGVAEVREQPDRKSGYINKKGEYFLQPQFDVATPFRDGFAVLKRGNTTAIMNKAGKRIATTQRKDIDWFDRNGFNDGLIAAGLHGESKVGPSGYLDKEGQWAIRPNFADAHTFSEGLAAVLVKEGSWGFIDTSGSLVVPPQFNEAFGFHCGIAIVRKLDNTLACYSRAKDAFIFEDGKKQVSFMGNFSDDRCRVVLKNPNSESRQKYYMGYLDVDGNMVIPAKLYDCRDFADGVAPVRTKHNSPWKYIDKEGQTVIEDSYYDAYPFSEDRAVIVDKEGRYGCINRKGETIIQPRLAYLGETHEGMSIFTDGRRI